MINAGRMNPGAHSAPDSPDPLAAFADFPITPNTADVDWSDEFDRIAEQTLGGSGIA